MEEVEFDFAEEDRVVDRLRMRLDHCETSLKEEQEEEARAIEHHKRALEAQEILQLTAQSVQQLAHKQISEVVSSCLKAVFGDDAYEFHIEFERKRGKTEASLRFKRGELDVDPLSATGGGVVDVAAFALRLASLVLHRPKLAKIVVLDEAFKFVSANYRENVRRMLEDLSSKMKLQIIMVTHVEELVTGSVIEI